MIVNIKIRNLTLHGFDYHSHKRIGDAILKELRYAIEKKGLDPAGLKDQGKIHSTIRLREGMDPRSVGRQLASSIRQCLK